MTTILQKDGSDVKTIVCSDQQCERDIHDRRCGYIYINKTSKIFKYCCLYCKNAYDDILNFCQHIMIHLYDSDELFNDGSSANDNSPIKVKTEIINDDPNSMDEEYAMEQLDDALSEDDAQDLLNEIDEWEQIAAEAEEEMRMNSEVFQECGYYSNNQRKATESVHIIDQPEEKEAQFEHSTQPFIVPKKVLYEKNSSTIPSYIITDNSNKNLKVISASHYKSHDDESIVVDSIPKTFKQKIIGETVITLIPEGVQPPKRSTKSMPKTAMIEIRSSTPSGLEEIQKSLPIITIDNEDSTNNTKQNSMRRSTDSLSSPNESPEKVKYYMSKQPIAASLKAWTKLGKNMKSAVQCPECEELFNDIQSLSEHIKGTHFPNGFKCKICKAKFKSLNLLDAHMRHEHLFNSYKCRLCQEEFADVSAYEEHANNENGCGYGYQCKICSKQFAKEKLLQIHMEEQHKDKTSTTATLKKCTICGKNTFRLETHMKIHMPRSSMLRKCPFCGKGFKFNSGLAAHIRMVHKKVRNINIKLISNAKRKSAMDYANEDEINNGDGNGDNMIESQNMEAMEDDNENVKILTEILDCDAFLDDDGEYLECSVEELKS